MPPAPISPINPVVDSSVPPSSKAVQKENVTLEDQTLIILARLMEGGQEDEDTCKELNMLTKLLSDDSSDETRSKVSHRPLFEILDDDCVETILGYLDMRQAPSVRGHATLSTSAYLKAAGDKGVERLSKFFHARVEKGTYDDLILAFSVATCLFPIVPDVISTLFLREGFVVSLGPLMKRKWKSKKVEQSALEMLNAACMSPVCRGAIRKYCLEWLEDIVNDPPLAGDLTYPEKHHLAGDGTHQERIHSELVKNLAAVILAKLQAVPLAPSAGEESRVQPATTSMEELSDKFKAMLSSPTSEQSSIEGLAYASLQAKVKESLAADKPFLKNLVRALREAPAKSPATYGALTIFVNLTSYLPVLTEEQKRMTQLKAYANASQASKPDPLNSDEHVFIRCQAVFEAGVIPVLVTHSQHGSNASLMLVASIIFSLSKTPKIRGQMAQQGAIKLLLHAFSVFPTDNIAGRRTTAHALARILITTNPLHVFGGSNPLSVTSAIRPLILILSSDPTTDHLDLLPVFESLLALTNLASTDDTARNPIVRLAFPTIEELLLSNNKMITRAAVELVCNLMQAPEGVAKFADGGKQASQRMHILLALCDSEDFATRRAAGGAMASLTEWDTAVNAILERDRGVNLLLGLCKEDEEELRHRGVVCILNILSAPGKVGEWGVKKVKDASGVDVLKECLKKSRSLEVLEITVGALKKLLGGERPAAALSTGPE